MPPPQRGAGGAAGAMPEGEGGTGDTTAAGGAAPTGSACSTATATLSATADANSPTLQSDSFLQRVESNDAYCAGHGFGKFPAFCGYGYQLSVHFKDAESDGPGTLEAVQTVGSVRLASDPDLAIMTRTDQSHWSLGGNSANGTAIIQLCLDRVYAASELTVGADVPTPPVTAARRSASRSNRAANREVRGRHGSEPRRRRL